MHSDLDLLRVELRTLWEHDPRGRLLRENRPGQGVCPHLVIGATDIGYVSAIGSHVPDRLARELEAAVAARSAVPVSPSERPEPLDECARLLEQFAQPIVVSSGPSYLIENALGVDVDADVVRSIDDHRQMNVARPDNWPPGEWADLLAGAMGPWAMAVAGERVVSLCHASRLTDEAAEAGVWTDPEYRGRGYAAAVTAAWASLLAPSGRYLFYSTSSENSSSRNVAARLNLRLIGWTWRLSSPPPG